MKLRLHRLALKEIETAAKWYRGRAENLDARFLDGVRQSLEKLETGAERFSKLETEPPDSTFRRIRVEGFPYILVFELFDDNVFVYAVVHTSRRSGYWHRRKRS